MNRLKEVLLNQYIGAITIGFILGEATIRLVNELANAIGTYWAIQQLRGSVMGEPRSFPWTNFITAMVSVAVQFAVGFFLMRWLYLEGEPHNGDDFEPAEGEGQS
jgi:uncharacterized membrane protein YwzB